MAKVVSYSEAISDLDIELRSLLFEGIKKDGVTYSIIEGEDKIDISSPDDTSAKLSIFLYKISENTDLKNQNFEIKDDEIKGNPIFLNLFYLITPNTKDNISDHIIMGKIIQIINDNPIPENEYFQKNGLKLLLNPLSIDDLNKIWSMTANSKPYKLSISIEITPLKIESMKTETITEVKEVELKFKSKDNVNSKTTEIDEELKKIKDKSIDIIEL